MPDTIRKVDYFSTQVSNRPGQTFRVLSTLVSAGSTCLLARDFRAVAALRSMLCLTTRESSKPRRRKQASISIPRRPASLFKATIVLAHWRTI